MKKSNSTPTTSDSKLEVVASQLSKKSEETPKTDKKEPKEPRVTKKSVVIELISTKKGALVDDIAKAIVDRGIDADLEKNIRVVKLWLAKIGFKVERDEKTLCYRKAS